MQLFDDIIYLFYQHKAATQLNFQKNKMIENSLFLCEAFLKF